MVDPQLADWVSVAKAARLVELETGHRPTRQTIYNWVERGWLKVGPFRPMRTTRHWILECLNAHGRAK